MYERYCEVRDLLGYKDAEIAKLTGIGRSTFSDWKAGRSTPKIEKLQKIADCLCTSVEYLTTGEHPHHISKDIIANNLLSNEEQMLVEAFRSADELTQQMVLRVLGLEKSGDSESLKEA